MSNYSGKSTRARVRLAVPLDHKWSQHWKKYNGQECDAILYEGDVSPQIDSEQLNPTMPRWQSVPKEWIVVL